MKRLGFFLFCFLILLQSGCDNTFSPRPLPPIEVRFSPKGGCTDAIVGELNAARSSILIQAYSFTSAPIAKAIVEAHRRGVHVEAILDSSHKTAKYSEADFLYNAGIPVMLDSRHAIAHNKIIIIDGQVVLTGSFNFTKSAEQSNAENLLIIRDTALADQYTANWKLHAKHSEPYGGRTGQYRESDAQDE
jgi:phosphatidylserine/phosphatidylglycerophosphate/cardiolipin synthase-like enzyme